MSGVQYGKKEEVKRHVEDDEEEEEEIGSDCGKKTSRGLESSKDSSRMSALKSLTRPTTEDGDDDPSLGPSESVSELGSMQDFGSAASGSLAASAKLKIDGYGRVINPDSVELALDKKKIAQQNERLRKWTKMIRSWDKYIGTDKFERRVRKGVPDAVRALVYSKIMNIEALRKGKEESFETLSKQEAVGPWDEIILRDIHRTNPTHELFLERDGIGQSGLYRVLRAYSLFDPEVGYCQGMGSFVSVMLTYVTEDDAFWMLVSLLQGKYPLRDMYLPSLVGIRRRFFLFDKALELLYPSLAKHLVKCSSSVVF